MKAWPFKKPSERTIANTVSVLDEDGRTVLVDRLGNARSDLLAVTPRLPRDEKHEFPYTITHVPTGAALSVHFKTVHHAVVAMEEMLTWDWACWATITQQDATLLNTLQKQLRILVSGQQRGHAEFWEGD